MCVYLYLLIMVLWLNLAIYLDVCVFVSAYYGVSWCFSFLKCLIVIYF